MLNMSVFWRYQGPEYASGSEQTRVLNKPGFWIYQGSENASGSEYASDSEFPRILNMPGLHSVLNMPEYVWLNIPGSVWICHNMREYG